MGKKSNLDKDALLELAEYKQTKSNIVTEKDNKFITYRVNLKCKNEKQKDFVNMINDNQIIFGVGPAGTGKSYCAVAKALELLKSDSTPYKKICIVKPIMEVGGRQTMGFLPGDEKEKLSVYVHSTLSIIDDIIGKDARKKLIEQELVVPMALAYVRGETLNNAILIFEEAQNADFMELKTILTRIGHNSKYIFTGDLEQSDKFKKGNIPLANVLEKLEDVNDIGIYMWKIDSAKDFVRNEIISKIIERLDS